MLSVLLLLWLVNGLQGATPDACQDGTGDGGNGQLCECSRTPDGNLTVDCSYRGLDTLPLFPSETSVLNLKHNNLTQIQTVDFDRLDDLDELILTGNELLCDCQLMDFKSWLLNIKSVSSSVNVTGAVCDNIVYSGQEVIEALFCFQDHNCHTCDGATSNDDCTSTSRPTCYPENACQNKVVYQASGELSINKTCIDLDDCLSSAADTNGPFCRQANRSTSVCVYCCQGTLCNKELNTINANYTFPFREPLPIATEPPSTDTVSMATEGQTGTLATVTSHFPSSPLGTTIQSTVPITYDTPITNLPNSTCFSEVTQGDIGVITWPATGANQTVTVPCPYNAIGVGISFACRICSWDATNGTSFWEEPNTEDCSSASSVLKELIDIQITEDNVIDVSSTLESVTSYPASLKANDVTNAVGVLSSLLRTLKLYPLKGREIFLDAMATAVQMTSVKFEELVTSQLINRTTSRLLHLIDEFTIQVPLINSTQLTSDSRAIDVIIVDAGGQRDESILFGGTQADEDDDVKPFISRNESVPGNGRDLLGSIHIPSMILKDAGMYLNTCQFLLYQKTTYFNAITTAVDNQIDGIKSRALNVSGTVLNSAVISASIGNLTLTDLDKPVRVHLTVLRTQGADNPQCVFWDVNANDFQGGWATEGCSLNTKLSTSETVVCECDHLTNFAMLMDIYNQGEPVDPVHAQILSVLSYVGCSISIVALTLTILTLGCFREEPKYRADGSGSFNTGNNGKARADRHTNILVHLSVALVLSNIAFLVNTITVELGLQDSVCVGMAAATHYSLLAAMAWMALEAFNMYLALVLVFDKYYSKFMLKMCLFGWGTPLVIVATTFGIKFPENYGLYNGLCWLSRIPFYAAFLAPVSAVLLFNLIIFLAVTWQLCKMRRRNISQSKRNFDLRAQLKACASITVLFGLTWFFALFGIGEANLAFSYLFVIFNTTQGFNIFVFQCLLKPSIRQRWLKLLRMQHKDITTSTKSSASGGKDSKNEGIVNAAELFRISETNGIDNPNCNNQL